MMMETVLRAGPVGPLSAHVLPGVGASLFLATQVRKQAAEPLPRSEARLVLALEEPQGDQT